MHDRSLSNSGESICISYTNTQVDSWRTKNLILYGHPRPTLIRSQGFSKRHIALTGDADVLCTLVSCCYSTLEVEAVRRDQFAEFAKAVQVGLLDYQGSQGIKSFFSLMKSRYGQVREMMTDAATLP